MLMLDNCSQPIQRKIVATIPQDRFSKAGRRRPGSLETEEANRLAGVLEELRLRH
jgi:hypothetical protein